MKTIKARQIRAGDVIFMRDFFPQKMTVTLVSSYAKFEKAVSIHTKEHKPFVLQKEGEIQIVTEK